MAVNSVDKAISYDDDEERVELRRGGRGRGRGRGGRSRGRSRRGGGARRGRGKRGPQRGRRGLGPGRSAQRAKRTRDRVKSARKETSGPRTRGRLGPTKKSTPGPTTRGRLGPTKKSTPGPSFRGRLGPTKTSSYGSPTGNIHAGMTSSSVNTPTKTTGKLDKSSKVVSKSNQAQQELANVTGGFKYNIDPKYSGNLAGAIMKSQKDAYDRSLQGRQEKAAMEALQAGEAKQVSPSSASVRSKVAEMETSRENLLNKAKQNKISNAELNQLSQMNRNIGLNETTGMGLMESLRYQGTRPELARDLKKTAERLGSIPTPMNLIRKAIFGAKELTQPVRAMFNEDLRQDIATGKFESGQERPGMFSGLREGIGNFFGGLDIGPSGVENERRGGERRALNLRDGIYGGVDPLSSSAVARDVSPLSTPATNVVNPTTGAIDYSSAMATSPVLSNQMLASPATLPTMATQGTPYRLRNYYAGVLGQDPAMYAANGGRVGRMGGGMMIMGDDGVVNNGIGSILSKYKEIRSQL
jgi:hypothetical protein|tara:strand:+ start:371 stop:1951 length:1581 start_codon:yes stop_codon:yes gene_type:complete